MCRVLKVSCAVSVAVASILTAQEVQDNKARVVPKERSISFNSQLVVEGRNDEVRKSISQIVDNTAFDLYKMLGVRPDTENDQQININMYEEGKAKAALKAVPFVTPLDSGGYHIELLVDTRTGVDREVLQRGMVEVLIYELSLRGKGQVADQKVLVPPWVSYGLLEAMKWKAEMGDRRIFDVLKENPDLYTVDEIFRASGAEVRKFDDTKESFFRASSCAMVMSLLRQPGGGESMYHFIKDVALHQGEIEDLLRKHFPGLNTGAMGLQKMWSLQVADMSSPRMLDVHSIAETEERLSEALFLTLTDESGISRKLPIDQYSVLKNTNLKTRLNAVSPSKNELMQLSYRCYPSYRPLLFTYIKVLEDIANERFEGVDVALVSLIEERALIGKAGERVRDYMDWHQISRAHEIKGDFEGYMQMKERLAAEREKKKDPVIDTYLDDMQRFFAK